MDLAVLKDKHPELYQEVFNLGAASITLDALMGKNPDKVETIRAEGRDQGIQAERERVVEILEVTGSEQVKLDAIKAGTGVKDALKLILERDAEVRNKNLNDLKTAASPAVGTDVEVETHTETVEESGETLEATAKKNWEKDPDLRAEFKDNYNSYLAFLKADKKGLVKIKGGKS